MDDQRRGKPGRDGRDGRDGEKGERGERGLPGVGLRGERGERGAPGERGELGPVGKDGAQGERGPMGPMPRHQWRTTDAGEIELRFQLPEGWGPWSENLRGPRGYTGAGGGASTIINQGGTGAGGVGMAYPWFLA